MKKTAFLSNVTFAFFTVFIPTLCFFRYSGLNLPFSLFLGSLCGALAATATGFLLAKKRRALFLKKTDEKEKEKFLFHLAMLSDAQKTELVQSALPPPVVRSGKLRLQTDDSLYALQLSFTPVQCDDVARFSRHKSEKQKILLCSAIEENALLLCEQLQIQVWQAEKVYQLFKGQNKLPKTYLSDSFPPKKRQRLRLCFSKRNAKRFLVGGSLLFLTAFLTPFPFYYFLFGSGLLVCAVLTRLFGYD
ncbi:MAG: hypothetical protein IJV85_03525 [Clostridia bacterium]|nr:hypothetical protein [Clostridia bacterium]